MTTDHPKTFDSGPAQATAATGSEGTPAGALQTHLASVHTATFCELLRSLHCSLALSTYQAGKLVLLRADGNVVNTHFRNFNRPMGIAVDRERLAIGTHVEIVECRNMPAVARRLQDPPRHDAVYVARHSHVTGAIDIHEMARDADGALWFVNTLFSCLCTLDARSSFVPRWRPPFVSSYAPEDRCHLNGLGMRDGRPRYVTALGETDAPQGWRVDKRDGGVLIDMQEDRVLACKLSMPHSPRWYADRLWLLESGRGALLNIDPDTGTRTEVARVPGFARGLAFAGPIAFIGLSRLRETGAFTDIEITETNADRQSGIWAVHIDTGATVGLLKFTGGVDEIFDVQALHGIGFPEIVHEGELLATTYALPDAALAEVAFTAEGRKE
jgi:uncharacterized protein (TIGR03032 family)